MVVLDARKHKAAKLLAAKKNQAQAAKELGVDRATVGRWARDPEFQGLIEQYTTEEAEQAEEGLAQLVPEALALLQRSLREGDVSASKMNAALNIVKAAATVEKETTVGSTLEARLAELDARNPRHSD